MKKSLSLLFFFLLFLQASYTQVYVAAPSGLSLRESPNKESKKLDLVPYGTAITAIRYDKNFVIIDGYRDQWIETKYNNKTGYIFGGYTLPFQLPNSKYKNEKEYFDDIFGPALIYDSIISNANDADYKRSLYTVYYPNGNIFSRSHGYEWHQYSILNNDITLEQGYLFACLLDRYFGCGYKNLDETKIELNTSFPTETITYGPYSITLEKYEGIQIRTEMCYLKISYLHGRIAIVWGGGV